MLEQSNRLNNSSGTLRLFLVLLFSFSISTLFAQIPSDLSKVKSAQITDAQLSQFLAQAQASGMTEEQVVQDFQRRGLPEAELQVLATRLKGIMGGSSTVKGGDNGDEKSVVQNKRSYKGETTKFKAQENPSRVFGADLFSGSEPLFVPNFKMATPKNYELGPEDELQLEIYGNNISSQKLVVSPDGFINVKYAGPINVNGSSIEKAAEIIYSRLLKFYPTLANGTTKLQLTLGSVRSIQVTIVGAVKKPGTITLPSVASLFNALYASGGPLENGSFRNIELIRNNKTIANADLYAFLLKGDQSANLGLRDNDVIRIPFATIQVVLEGGLNRTGIFEVKKEESFQDALNFAGGFRKSAFRGRVSGTRFTDVEMKVIDVAKDDFGSFKLTHGDSLYIDSVVNRFENRVIITGAVFKPGAYALNNQMELKDLINKAEGVKEDAFTGRVNIFRVREDLTEEVESIDLRPILSGKQSFILRKEDSLHVVSVIDLKDNLEVSISGPVRNPGNFNYIDSMTLQGLILQAGGFSDNAAAVGIEIGRRKEGIDPSQKGANTSEIIRVAITKELNQVGADVQLRPYDRVSIKTDPSKLKQISVRLSGELLFAGQYTLENPDERISSLLKRAGGPLPYADIEGAKLLRKTPKADTAQLRRLAASQLKSENKDSVELDQAVLEETTDVALNLKKALGNPGSVEDVILQDGDELVVPRFNNTIVIRGAVLNPITVQFDEKRGLNGYVSFSGGYSSKAAKSRTFVVYPNGSSSRTHSFLGIRAYPKIKPGSQVFVPEKPESKGLDTSKLGVLVSALTAITTTAVLLFR
jgi:protein involved in polysaccharide export with SLBB domain